MMNYIYIGDNLPILQEMESASVDLIYIDPPFNTGKSQQRTRIKTVQSTNGKRIGFQGQLYETVVLGTKEYNDKFGHHFNDYLLAFLKPRLLEAYRILSDHGTLYFHIDYREVHYCKVLLDAIFGEECFLNELIWAYDYGGKSKSKWPPKHDNILVYVKDKNHYTFNNEQLKTISFKAPGPEGAMTITPSDTWWHTIVPTNSKERTGYPTQKPIGILNRIIKVSSDPGDVVLDFFAGSGTTGESCLALERHFILIDNNLQAMEVMQRRFHGISNIKWIDYTRS